MKTNPFDSLNQDTSVVALESVPHDDFWIVAKIRIGLPLCTIVGLAFNICTEGKGKFEIKITADVGELQDKYEVVFLMNLTNPKKFCICTVNV